jgi:hypothetical protein
MLALSGDATSVSATLPVDAPLKIAMLFGIWLAATPHTAAGLGKTITSGLLCPVRDPTTTLPGFQF